MNTERRALVMSAGFALAIGLVALVVGLLSGSGAILLDAAFNLCFFVTALLTLRVATLLERPDNARYPFGYVQFEPLINLVKSLLILATGLVALFEAGRSILRGGNAIEADVALVYAVGASLACALALLLLRRAAKKVASPLLDGDVGNWTVNLAISSGMACAFVLALFLQRLDLDVAARFVDPVLVSLVVLLTLAVPIRMALGGLLGLLKRAPDDGTGEAIAALVAEALAGLPVKRIFVRPVRPGRSIYVVIHVVLTDEGAHLTLGALDGHRRAVLAALAGTYAAIVADIVFTTREELAAPTTVAAFAAAAARPDDEAAA